MTFELNLLESALNDNTVTSVAQLHKWLGHSTIDDDAMQYANKMWDKKEERSRLIRLATAP